MKTPKPWNEDVHEIRVLWTVGLISPCARENDILWFVHDMLNWVVVYYNNIVGRKFSVICVEQGIEIFKKKIFVCSRLFERRQVPWFILPLQCCAWILSEYKKCYKKFLGIDSWKLLGLWIFSLNSTPKQMLFGLTREEIVCIAVEQRPTLVPQVLKYSQSAAPSHPQYL